MNSCPLSPVLQDMGIMDQNLAALVHAHYDVKHCHLLTVLAKMQPQIYKVLHHAPVLMLCILVLLFATQGYGVASFAGGTAVLLTQCPLSVRAVTCNLFRVPAIAHPLFGKETVESLTSSN